MPSIQTAYPVRRAADGSRAAAWLNPKQGELLIRTREEAYKTIESMEKQLRVAGSKHKKVEILIARAMVYEATGDIRMVQAAEDAWKCTRTSTTAHLMAVGYHHLGDMKKACQYYFLAHQYPHEAGFNIDLAYTQALLFEGRWSEAHKETLKLKKRMVYAAYLPEWDRKPCKELSLISEGGFGDIIHTGRWIPILKNMVDRLVVYLPPMFFESGFVDLMKQQVWCPEIKLLTETPMKVPAIGFFDLPAVFDAQPDNLPEPLPFQAIPLQKSDSRPAVGFCWAASASETPLCPRGVYRSLTTPQAYNILHSTKDICWVGLQKGESLADLPSPPLLSWGETAQMIASLDAVVTVDTAVLHLACSMGKPTYVPLSGALDWKFGLHENKTPWYPTARLFKNNAFGFDRAVSNLIEYIKDGKLHTDVGTSSSLRQNLS